jgi:hypothetical protein
MLICGQFEITGSPNLINRSSSTLQEAEAIPDLSAGMVLICIGELRFRVILISSELEVFRGSDPISLTPAPCKRHNP